MMPLILFGVLLNAFAQLALKAGVNRIGHFDFSLNNIWPIGLAMAGNIYILGGLFLYGVSVIVWLMALSRVDVSFAYPMLSVGYIINAVAAYYLFDENLSVTRLAGIGVIIVGVYLISRTA
ncbi:MAG: EamA family transporter [Dongiaceae bacterium]